MGLGKRTFIVTMVIMALLIMSASSVWAMGKLPEEELQQQMLGLINGEREKEGVVTLQLDQELTEVALAHAADMIARDYFSHWNPEGLSPADRLRQVNVSFQIMGENLAGNTSVNNAHRMLMESPSHRSNILHDRFRQAGIGIIKGGRYGYMMVMVFRD